MEHCIALGKVVEAEVQLPHDVVYVNVCISASTLFFNSEEPKSEACLSSQSQNATKNFHAFAC
jgi:hypothetical protein